MRKRALMSRRLRVLQGLRPRTADQLHRFVQRGLGLDVARTAVDPGSTPPFDYLRHAYFHGGDCVVWANRGGGKTMLGAVATLLDLLFKPGVQVRILGGSLEQSTKMYEHLTALLERPLLSGRHPAPGSGGTRGEDAAAPPAGRSTPGTGASGGGASGGGGGGTSGGGTSGGGVLAWPATGRRVVLGHGSRAEILAGSQRSVRGTRVHKLRCDEVEEFDPAVWEAAQLVTRSGDCGGTWVRGGVEGLSTMHRPFGLMSRLVQPGSSDPGSPAPGSSNPLLESEGDDVASPLRERSSHRQGDGLKIFKWNAMDVAARCPAELPCAGCILWDDCGGRAKAASGFVPIEDLMDQRRRTSDLTWNAEMMCRRPGVRDSVYPSFTVERHVTPAVAWGQEASTWVGGMDFGLRCPHVMLWARAAGSAATDAVHVVDEYVVEELTMDRHLEAMARQAGRRGWPAAAELDWVGVDPAGHQRSRHSGRTDVALLREAGYRVRARRAAVAAGIELVRRRLDRGTLTIHPRCTQLIRALQSYRFDPQRPGREEPIKDGPDHACDALRYLLWNLEHGGGPAVSRSYM